VITEKQVQESMDYLFDSAMPAAQARADREVLEQGLKRVKALEMRDANAKTIGERETTAYASDAYRVALEGLREAITKDETFRALRAAHAARLESWRTQQATMRSVKL
jgi:queuine/archaeosine tRNA-ribosyltransferase